MTKPKLIVVTGISGSGKTTVARKLIERGEVALDSKVTPNIYHFIDLNGNEVRQESVSLIDPSWTQKYRWVLNEPMLNELLARYHDRRRVFLCGRANLARYWHLADTVFLLHIDEDTLLKRLNDNQRDNEFAKDTATQQKLLGQLEMVQQTIAKKGGVLIDARQSIDETVDYILSHS